MAESILSDLTPGLVLGDAVYIASFENQSQEWHDLRTTGIGGSDVGTICGLNPWQSALTLWAKRTGRIPSESPSSEAMEWGTRLESVILDKFVESHPELEVISECGTWCHKDRAWQLANPDGLYRVNGELAGVIEVKTARYGDDWANGVPAYYRTQVQWYLQTFGLPHAYVIVLIGGSTYKEFEVLADDFEQAANLDRVTMFKKYLDTDEAPDYDGSFSTLETIREMHPDIDKESSVELGELGVHYSLAIADLNQATSHANEMKSRVLDAMGLARTGHVDGNIIVTRQAKAGGTPYLVNKKGL